MTETYAANGARFLAEHDMIIRWIRSNPGQAFEPVTTAWMFAVMAGREGAFIDCGASTGWFSVAMRMRGHEVHAFEPNPTVSARLLANADLNGVGLHIHDAAVSDHVGTATLYHNAGLPLTSGASLNLADCLAPTGRLEVRTVTLDDALEGVSPALVKIDIEGHEIAALNGARGLLRAYRPHLMLEANTLAHKDALSQWLQDFGGYSWRLADSRNMLCEPV